MKLKWKKLFTVMFFLVMALSVQSVSAQAASVKKVCRNVSRNRTFYQDLTGDGKKDQVTLKLYMDRYGYLVEKANVYVNGKKALTISDIGGYNATIQYVYQAKSREFLQIYFTSDNDYVVKNCLYQYNKKTGKLVRVLNLSGSKGKPGDIVKVTSKSVRAEFSCQPAETGWINWVYEYTWKNGKFVLKSNIADVKSSLSFYDPGDGYTKYFKKNQFVTANKIKFYTSTSLGKTAFTANRGDVLTLKKIKVSGNNVYLQFKKGSKTGWQKVYRTNAYDYSGSNPGKTGWFYGVFNRLAG